MDKRRRLTGVALIGVMLLVAAACGQKPGVVDEPVPASALGGALPPGAAAVDAEGNILDAEGNIIGASGGTGAVGGTGGGGGTTTIGGTGTGTGTTTSGGTGTGTGTTTSGGGGGGAGGGGGGGGGAAPGGGNTTGVSDDTIKIGIHAPLTGAAPVPSNSVEKGKDLYFRWLAANGGSINGRRVQVVLKNDNYNPSQAVAVCKEMVERDRVFLLTGAAGTDQIQACARYAASVGVPYISAGVTEKGVTGLPNYFTTSMTYADQGPLLAKYLVRKLGGRGERNGLLFFDTPNFQDAAAGFKNGLRQLGAKLHYERYVSKAAGDAEARAVVQEMKTARINNVYVLTSPFWFIDVLHQANSQSYRPQWIGVGISMTFDTVAAAGCPGINGARFFSPFPAWVDSDKYDKNFRAAVRKFESDEGNGDDFMWLSWIATKVIAEMLKLPGKNLTRERFVYSLERKRGLKVGVGPTLSYSPSDHFGANSAYVSEARCGDRRWHTIVTPPASDF